MNRRKSHDAYDGHANYRASFEPRPAGEVLRHAVHVIVRVVLSTGILLIATRLTFRAIGPASTVEQVVAGLLAGFVGLVSFVIAFVMLQGLGKGSSRAWSVRDIVALGIFAFGFAVPYMGQKNADQRVRAERAARQEVSDARMAEAARRLEQGDAITRHAPAPHESATSQADMLPRELVTHTYMPSAESPAPTPETPEQPATRKHEIIKCRDSSGAIQFTQAYCPPGTKRVDAQ